MFGKWLYLPHGIKPFQRGNPEHPEFEHSNMSVHALAEIYKVSQALHQKLPQVSCPVMIIHGSNDPVVDSASAMMIHERVGSLEKRIHLVASDRHGILHENIGNTQEVVIARLGEVTAPVTVQISGNAGRRMLRNWNLLRWAAPRLALHRAVDSQTSLD
jgi:pimeloyl-ACP methyl ester carboxylesterase